MAIFFQQQFAEYGLLILLRQPPLHRRNSHHIGFDNATLRGGFRESLRQIRRKAGKAIVCIGNVLRC